MITATQTNLDKFRQVYADAVKNTLSRETRSKTRSLHWHGPRVSLAEAAELYAEIESYNKFESDTIAKLAAEFPDAGIEVTPARESSVAIYLRLPFRPEFLRNDVKRFVEKKLAADEIEIVTKFTCLQEGETEMEGVALRIWWD